MRGISFDAESVRAFPVKTQTRRVMAIKVPGPESIHDAHAICKDGAGDWIAWFGKPTNQDYPAFTRRAYPDGGGFACPYGKPGDRLYVRERLIRWDQDGTAPLALYDAHRDVAAGRTGGHRWMWKRAALPACFMPRHLSRFTIELLDVRAERVRSISERDCEAEIGRPAYSLGDRAYKAFRTRWDSINDQRGFPFDSNPWVWALTYRVIA